MIREIGFWIGIAMISWDMLGHACCLLARLTGYAGATLWNNYSKLIWPSISNSIRYDSFWTLWFSVALILIVQGKLNKE